MSRFWACHWKNKYWTSEHNPEGAPLGASGSNKFAGRGVSAGDVVYVELPKVGAKFGRHDVFGTIEAVKAVSELFSPVAGEVVAINSRLDGEPALVNTAPYTDGWMVKMKVTNPSENAGLMNAAAYSARLGQ